MATEQLQDEQAAQLLAQANLHRMRKQWDEAMTCCMQVLYHAPDNWRAHALLGDIYSDLDRPEDAIQWYCMTLDIRSDAHSVREKLSTLVNSRRRQIVSSLDPTRPYRDREGRSYFASRWGWFAWHWSSPERRKQLAIIGAVCIAAAVIIISTVSGSHTTPAPSGAVFTAGPAPTTPGVFLQPVPPAAPQPVVSVPTPATNTAVSPAPAASGGGGLRDVGDQALTQGLMADSTLHADAIQVADAQMDPSTSTVTVTFLSTGPALPTPQARDLRDAAEVARAALGLPETASMTTAVLRCLTQSGQSASGPTLTFIGSITRSSVAGLTADYDTLTQQQLQAAFTSTWWSPNASVGA